MGTEELDIAKARSQKDGLHGLCDRKNTPKLEATVQNFHPSTRGEDPTSSSLDEHNSLITHHVDYGLCCMPLKDWVENFEVCWWL